MSKAKNGRVFEHVQRRAAERYGVHLSRETWERWNVELRKSIAAEGGVERGALSVREVMCEGVTFIALCSDRRVLTVTTLSHAMRLFSKERAA